MDEVVDELGAVFISICAGACVLTWMAALLAYVSELL